MGEVADTIDKAIAEHKRKKADEMVGLRGLRLTDKWRTVADERSVVMPRPGRGWAWRLDPEQMGLFYRAIEVGYVLMCNRRGSDGKWTVVAKLSKLGLAATGYKPEGA